MIYCVRFADIEAYLHDLGFDIIGETDSHYLFRGSTDIMTIHRPNVHGDVTEIEMTRAFDAAEIAPPRIDPHYCD